MHSFIKHLGALPHTRHCFGFLGYCMMNKMGRGLGPHDVCILVRRQLVTVGAGGVGDREGACRLPREVTVEWRPEGYKGGRQRHICGAVLGRRDSDSLVPLVTLAHLAKGSPG